MINCGATIISDRWMVGAAHCFSESDPNRQVNNQGFSTGRKVLLHKTTISHLLLILLLDHGPNSPGQDSLQGSDRGKEILPASPLSASSASQ